ncbi:MAG: hypothetical protein JW819_08105 [Candidatus Krumholzibacteriota bacterium]|nr:hypothetical protein [Candidatus Krumholzibacteriota bacterium]
MMLELAQPWLMLLIFLARITDVSMGTVRTIAVVRGRVAIASMLGFVEVIIWIIVVGHVVRTLDNPYNIIAYAAGFATGNAVGIWIERKVALGDLVLRIISRGQGHQVAEAIRELGQPVTEFEGRGRLGPVQLLYVVVDRALSGKIEKAARAVDIDSVIVAEDARSVHLHMRPTMTPRTGWRSIIKKK